MFCGSKDDYSFEKGAPGRKDGEEAPLTGKRWDCDGTRDEVPLFCWRNEARLDVKVGGGWGAS